MLLHFLTTTNAGVLKDNTRHIILHIPLKLVYARGITRYIIIYWYQYHLRLRFRCKLEDWHLVLSCPLSTWSRVTGIAIDWWGMGDGCLPSNGLSTSQLPDNYAVGWPGPYGTCTVLSKCTTMSSLAVAINPPSTPMHRRWTTVLVSIRNVIMGNECWLKIANVDEQSVSYGDAQRDTHTRGPRHWGSVTDSHCV